MTSLKGLLLAAAFLVLSSSTTARVLLQDAPTDELTCDVAVIGGGPGEENVWKPVCTHVTVVLPG